MTWKRKSTDDRTFFVSVHMCRVRIPEFQALPLIVRGNDEPEMRNANREIRVVEVGVGVYRRVGVILRRP